MESRASVLPILLALSIALSTATAGESAEDEVYVYTNDDLARVAPAHVFTNEDVDSLEPMPTSPPIADWSEDLGWDFVTDFIERERERIDADRAHDLERAYNDAQIREIDDDLDRRSGTYGGYLPWFPYYGGGRHPGVGHGRVGGAVGGSRGHDRFEFRVGSPRRPGDYVKPIHARPGGNIKPIHARPGGNIKPFHARPSRPATVPGKGFRRTR